MQIENLSSTKNPKIKELQRLIESSKERRLNNLIPIEGVREIRAAIKSGFTPLYIFFNEELISSHEVAEYGAPIAYSVSGNLYKHIAYRESTEGVVAVMRTINKHLYDIILSENPLIIVLESVEKPGNLGAILRTADAVNADAVIICDPLTDIFNPNIIRSSLGGIFTKQVISCDSKNALKWLKSKKINIFAAELNASVRYDKTDFTSPTAIVMGTESSGLSKFWIDSSNFRIKIPMLGEIDSLNVSVSTAIICYEVLRQRNFKTN